MTAVIKSSDLDRETRVRALSLEPPAPQPSPQALAIADLETRLAAALERTSALEAEAESLKQDVEAAWKRGRDAGVAEGRSTAEDRSQALLAAVTAASDKAVEGFHARLESLDLMAAGLASLALGRITTDPDARRDLVAGAVRRALAETAAEAVVRIEVSRADFPDAAGLTNAVQATAAEVLLVDGPSGICRIRLKLGEIDLGLDGQVARLRALLDTAGAPE